MNKGLIIILLLGLVKINGFTQSNEIWGNWRLWGEQYDGTYKNPVIPADYSDIGRIVSLLPVTWIDNWPIIGTVLPGNIGSMRWSSNMPNLENENFNIKRSDDFDGSHISEQWEWNYQPRKDMYSLNERKGWLRQKAYKPLKENQLLYAGNTLTQRCFRTFHNEVTIKMDISHMADGQKNGLCHFSEQYSFIGIKQENNARRLEYNKNGKTILDQQKNTENNSTSSLSKHQ